MPKEIEIFYSDIETTEFKSESEIQEIDDYQLEFKLGCILNDEMEYRFHSFNQNDFCNELVKDVNKYKLKRIYFHNLAFDSKFLFNFLYNHFDKCNVIKTNSRILAINCYFKNSQNKFNKVMEIRDSLSILLYSIKNLGKMCNLPKLEFDFDYNDMEMAIEYCYRDCQIIYESFKLLVDCLEQEIDFSLKIRDLPLTIGALSKKILKSFYPEVFYKTDLTIEQSLRNFYFGGRTEVFDFNICKEIAGFDFNSLYPDVLSNNDFALGKVIEIDCNSMDFSSGLILAYKCIVYESQFYPLFPKRVNDKVLFCNGLKEVIITKPEYELIQNQLSDKVKVIKVKSMFVCKSIGNFSKYFERFYYLRKSFDNESPFVYIIKILMNSGYGKFGQLPFNINHSFLNPVEIDWSNLDNMNVMEIDDIYFTETEKLNEYLDVNLMNAILTTSYARLKLWKLLYFCYKNGIKVYYCDTDSIYIQNNPSDIEKLKDFIDDYLLGKLKIEITYDLYLAIDSKEYLGYNIDNETFSIKFKGVKKEYINSIDKLLNHIKHGTNTNLIGTFFYCLRRHSEFNTIHVIRKHKHSYFEKRIILDDFSTIPFTYITKKQKNSNKFKVLSQLFKFSEIINFLNG